MAIVRNKFIKFGETNLFFLEIQHLASNNVREVLPGSGTNNGADLESAGMQDGKVAD
jgi:hypothetical protein